MSILSDIQLALKKSSEAHLKLDSIKSWKPEDTALPVLYLTGDTSKMTKDNAVDLNYVYGERSGTLSCKWQGSSSLSYPKKNFTIKFDTAFEAKEGWGEQKKYCLKANYIDASHARNIVSATIWGQMVKTRSEADSRLTALPNGGAIDGFPILVYINNEYQGLYTWNIPKDAWMFGMGELDTEAIICADMHVAATRFKAEAAVDGSDFELEYAPDEDNSSWIVTSINRLINACNTDTPDLDTIGQYIDIQSAIDYYIFTCFVEGVDATDKNYLLGTYDGTKWFFSAYDLDTTFGNHWNGKSYYEHDKLSFSDYASTHKMMELILANKKTELVTRYKELRADILSEANLLHLLSNFVCNIPSAAYEQESVIWPEIPGTKSNDINQIMEFMRVRLEWLDAEMGYGNDFDYSKYGLPVLYLVGNTSTMTKDNAVDLVYTYGDMSGIASVKWQGTSSLSYPKKNYTIKFDQAFEAITGWGEQTKYCLKANYIDHSHARNLIGAKLWGEIVQRRVPKNIPLYESPGYGAVEGFPVCIVINNRFEGVYTFNIPKDAWMMDMGSGINECILCAEKGSDITHFKSQAKLDGTDFEVEYITDENDIDWARISLNNLINACINSDGTNLNDIGAMLDWESAIDYYIFVVLINGADMIGKNYIFATYDGTKWFFSAYDMDSTFGLHWNGNTFLSSDLGTSFAEYAATNRVMELIWLYKKDELINRYNELRKTVMSGSNVTKVFSVFASTIPKTLLDEDARIWPLIPNTNGNNVAQIINWYHDRCKAIDAEIDAYAKTEFAITKQPVDATAAIGEIVTFEIEADDVSAYMWQYSTDGTKFYDLINDNYVGYDSASVSFTPGTSSINWFFLCRITSTNGRTLISDVVTIKQVSSRDLKITQQPKDAKGMLNDVVSFNLDAEGVVSYQWQYSTDGTKFYNLTWDSASRKKLYVNVTLGSAAWYYRCILTGSNSTTLTSDTVRIIPSPKDTEIPPAYELPTASATVKGGVKVGGDFVMDGETLKLRPEEEFELYQTITLEEAVNSIEVDIPASVEVRVECTINKCDGNAALFFDSRSDKSDTNYRILATGASSSVSSTYKMAVTARLFQSNGTWDMQCYSGAVGAYRPCNGPLGTEVKYVKDFPTCAWVRIYTLSVLLAVGSEFNIYIKRAVK